ncbi:hypothetical protein PFISCL1PPCAC_24513 [Pristionchus fissidentatus]|uniref:G protein-coupled receptor n=1 Tax=Pristionchus fissidentatus TaxID=1538716 RepID=A0AAV5WQC4_9BILA|nr:hypothetical protein PFISCL1PPCAC_24513 [Pristionchus fissidentatus]
MASIFPEATISLFDVMRGTIDSKRNFEMAFIFSLTNPIPLLILPACYGHMLLWTGLFSRIRRRVEGFIGPRCLAVYTIIIFFFCTVDLTMLFYCLKLTINGRPLDKLSLFTLSTVLFFLSFRAFFVIVHRLAAMWHVNEDDMYAIISVFLYLQFFVSSFSHLFWLTSKARA